MKKIIGPIILMVLSILNVSAATPVAIDDVAVTNEDNSVLINVLSNDTDADGNSLTVTSIGSVLNGSGSISLSGTGVTFTPNANFNGTGSFDYVVSDGTGSDIGHVVVTVNPVNDAPVAVDDTFTMSKNTEATINLTSNDTDVDLNTLTVTSLGSILNGAGSITSSGTGVRFIPTTNFVGTVSFGYVVSDGNLTDTGTVTITVTETSTNNSPVAVDDEISLEEDKIKTFNPRINDTDADGDSLIITGKTNGTHGVVTFTSTTLTYNPNNDFVGSDTFTYTISDSKGGTDTGTVKVTVFRDDDDDDDEDEDDDDDKDKSVKNIQKEFQGKFKELKNKYKHKMNSREYKNAKKELQEEYHNKLKEVTGRNNNSDDDDDDKSTTINVKGKYKFQGNLVKSQYKNEFQIKYGTKISSLDDNKLTTIIGKIDNLIDNINSNSNYSDSTKARLNTMLLALRELIFDNLNNEEGVIDIDALFE